MPRIEPFEQHTSRYEAWFDRNQIAYHSELEAVRLLLPGSSCAIEVGVGTGRFAAPLGIRIGVEPSPAMGTIAVERGIEVLRGVAEYLPFKDACFDLVLMVTTICFLDDVLAAFKEAQRVLMPNGHILIGFLDRQSKLGRSYEKRREESVFYKLAKFCSAQEVHCYLHSAGFCDLISVQTLFKEPHGMNEVVPASPGTGEGSFAVVRGKKR